MGIGFTRSPMPRDRPLSAPPARFSAILTVPHVLTLHILFTLASFFHIRPYSIFYLSITGYFYFRRVVRNDSLVRRLRRQRSRTCAVGRLGTIERRHTVAVFVKPLLEEMT